MSISEHEAKVLSDFEAYEAEIAILRARVAELECERDAVTACLAGREKYLGERIQTLIESGDLSARAVAFHADRAAEMERERDEARGNLRLALEGHDRELASARADAARLRGVLESLLPGVEGERVNEQGVDWSIACGRYCLSVAGWSVAMEGDISRDEKTPRYWDGPSIKAVVEHFAAPIRAALASAPSAEPEGPDYSGLCSAPECGGHCGYVHAVGCEAIREYLAEHGGAPYKAPARTAHRRRKGEEWKALLAEPLLTPKS